MHVDRVWYTNSPTSVKHPNVFALPVCFYHRIYFQIQIKYWTDIPLLRRMESETKASKKKSLMLAENYFSPFILMYTY